MTLGPATRVTVKPAGHEFDVPVGETMMHAAERHGLSWPTVCGGLGNCRACVLEVRSGAEALVAMDEAERRGLEQSFRSTQRRGFLLRLACQAKAAGGEITVFKPGVRRRP